MGRRENCLRGHRVRVGACLWSMVFVLLLATAGCELEVPQKPQFETTLYVPMSEETYTGQDMADKLEAVEGNVEEPGPLTIRVSEEFEPVLMEEHLKLNVEADTYSAGLDQIDFDAPAIAPVSMHLSDLLPEASGEVPIPPTSLEPVVVDLGTFNDYAEVTFLSGALHLMLVNNLSIPVGGEGEHALLIEVQDDSAGVARSVATWTIEGEIQPGGKRFTSHDLPGQPLGNHFILHVTGWSSGSDGKLVDIASGGSLNATVSFQGVEISTLTGLLPALSCEIEFPLEMSEDISIEHAVVADGVLSWSLASELPVDARVFLHASQITREGVPLYEEITVPARGSAVLTVDLCNAVMEIGAADSLVWSLGMATQATGDPEAVELGLAVVATLQATEIRFDSMRGILDHVDGEITPVAAAIEFPEGTEEAQFLIAEMAVVVCNNANVSIAADLELWGEVDGAAVHVPFSTTIAAGSHDQPESTWVFLDESNSNLLDLLNLRPETVTVSGSVQVGDGFTVSEIRAGDSLEGCFTLQAPMRLLLETAQLEGEPFEIESDEELREQIADNLVEVFVAADVENHFPTGVEVKLHFAKTEGALFVNDDLVLEADAVQPAEVDTETGRVTASVYDEIVMQVTEQEDIAVFAEELLYGAMEITLTGDGENPVEIWSTDYVKVRGIVSFRYRVD
ncbi:MAG: hypothetical protein KAY24_04435 [Candidatus Eisenbacteria sp.]|nr:hypothetical protein [Candidatus Eisenbacteria bacterium]